MKKIIFLVFLTACASKNVNHNTLDFNMDLTFEEFKVLKNNLLIRQMT